LQRIALQRIATALHRCTQLPQTKGQGAELIATSIIYPKTRNCVTPRNTPTTRIKAEVDRQTDERITRGGRTGPANPVITLEILQAVCVHTALSEFSSRLPRGKLKNDGNG
jgi:hypothetical protein